jgi:hypothetical protein
VQFSCKPLTDIVHREAFTASTVAGSETALSLRAIQAHRPAT